MTQNDRLATMDHKMDMILAVLKGNPNNSNDKGITGIIAEQNTRLKKVEDDHKKFHYTLYGMAIMAGYAGFKLLQTIFSFIK